MSDQYRGILRQKWPENKHLDCRESNSCQFFGQYDTWPKSSQVHQQQASDCPYQRRKPANRSVPLTIWQNHRGPCRNSCTVLQPWGLTRCNFLEHHGWDCPRPSQTLILSPKWFALFTLTHFKQSSLHVARCRCAKLCHRRRSELTTNCSTSRQVKIWLVMTRRSLYRTSFNMALDRWKNDGAEWSRTCISRSINLGGDLLMILSPPPEKEARWRILVIKGRFCHKGDPNMKPIAFSCTSVLFFKNHLKSILKYYLNLLDPECHW